MNNSRRNSDNFAENGGYALEKYLFECVRNGNRNGIEKEISTLKFRHQIRGIYDGDLHSMRHDFMFFWSQINRVAIDGGVSERAAVTIYDKYYSAAQQLTMDTEKTVEKLIDLNVELIIEYASYVEVQKEAKESSLLVKHCRSYINEHVSQPLSIDMIAEALHFSRSYLSHVYKEETGETVYSRIKKEKIENAMILMKKNGVTLTEIAFSLGFSSQSHFCNFFRKATGMTPREYRSKQV